MASRLMKQEKILERNPFSCKKPGQRSFQSMNKPTISSIISGWGNFLMGLRDCRFLALAF
jgi:hypothetical protein